MYNIIEYLSVERLLILILDLNLLFFILYSLIAFLQLVLSRFVLINGCYQGLFDVFELQLDFIQLLLIGLFHQLY